jgi:tetratricopeptide (TPR) repeat protein
MTTRLALAAAVTVALALPLNGHAAVTVLGNNLAQICWTAALTGGSGRDSLETCSAALAGGGLNKHDRVGTYVNRGIIKLRRKMYRDARADFDTALRFNPELGEAFVNKGAAYLGEKDYFEAIKLIDRGLDLGTNEPEKAYFNRGIAYEKLGRLEAAYLDYRHAYELKPGWDLAKYHMLRFTVEWR